MIADVLLRSSLGAILVVFGIDQLRDWQPWAGYMPSWLKWVELPNEKMFWRGHAALNVLLGILLLSGFYLYWVSLLVAFWLALITIAVFSTDWQTALRDLGLTAAAFALWLLVSNA